MSDRTLDRLSKLGPLITFILALLGGGAMWGHSTSQIGSVATTQQMILSDLKKISADLAAQSAGSMYQREAVTDLSRRITALESERRR